MAPDQPVDVASPKQELLDFIRRMVPDLPDDLDDDDPLISSGLVESLRLLELVMWIEERIDPHVDITAFDLVAEWDTLRSILGFVGRYPAPPVHARQGFG